MEHVNKLLGELLHVVQPLGMMHAILLAESKRPLAQQRDAIFHELDGFNHKACVKGLVP
jgi:hypothetical protein